MWGAIRLSGGHRSIEANRAATEALHQAPAARARLLTGKEKDVVPTIPCGFEQLYSEKQNSQNPRISHRMEPKDSARDADFFWHFSKHNRAKLSSWLQ
ncbi:unnamed protein product, partial [Darwinula stevensoni]